MAYKHSDSTPLIRMIRRKPFILLLSLLILLVAAGSGCRKARGSEPGRPVSSRKASAGGLGREGVIKLAREASGMYPVANRRYVTIIDYSLSILSDRLYVVDMERGEVVIESPVSHALNSGLLYAHDFSNVAGSQKSCIGAFQTQESYNGRFGYAMRIKGIQPGLNDKARGRAIVFHTYKVWPVYSQGCFVTPKDVNARLIDLIKNGSLVYVHAP